MTERDGNAVFKVKLVNLGFLFDAFSAFSSPAGGTFRPHHNTITGNRGGVSFDSLGSGAVFSAREANQPVCIFPSKV